MKILLDTQIFLWYISADGRLPKLLKEAIIDPNNDVFLSVVSLWEIIVKHQLGKLPLPQSPEVYIPQKRELHQIASLDLDESSVAQLINLPSLHRDPFDRMLICLALQHTMSLATVDRNILQYPVRLFGLAA